MSGLWQMLFSLGYHGSISYNGDFVERERNINMQVAGYSMPNLDPIHVAGSLTVATVRKIEARLIQLNLIALLPATSFLLSEEVCHSYLLSESSTKERTIKYTNQRYRDHFAMLVEWGILEEGPRERARYISTYFEVAKGALSRAILNGKRLSLMFKPPPNVNIPDIPCFIRRFANHFRLFCAGNVVSGDLRHWFHQIESPRSLRHWFGLVLAGMPEGRAFFWKTMPMGFSYSPWVAQSLCWALLSWREPLERPFLDEESFRNDGLPTFVNVIKWDKEGIATVVGFACVYYDNYFVAVADNNLAIVISNRIKRNARTLGIHIKGESAIDMAEGVAVSHVLVTNAAMKEQFESIPNVIVFGCVYLGIHFSISRKRAKGTSDCKLQWRLAKIDKWKTALSVWSVFALTVSDGIRLSFFRQRIGRFFPVFGSRCQQTHGCRPKELGT